MNHSRYSLTPLHGAVCSKRGSKHTSKVSQEHHLVGSKKTANGSWGFIWPSSPQIQLTCCGKVAPHQNSPSSSMVTPSFSRSLRLTFFHSSELQDRWWDEPLWDASAVGLCASIHIQFSPKWNLISRCIKPPNPISECRKSHRKTTQWNLTLLL